MISAIRLALLKNSATSFSKFSSYLRTDNTIKDSSVVLDREWDQILHFDSKDFDKTSSRVFETESDDEESETSLDFTSSRIIFDYLEECSIASLESVKVSYEYHSLDVDYHFRYKLLEDKPKIYDTQSSEIVGIVYD